MFLAQPDTYVRARNAHCLSSVCKYSSTRMEGQQTLQNRGEKRSTRYAFPALFCLRTGHVAADERKSTPRGAQTHAKRFSCSPQAGKRAHLICSASLYLKRRRRFWSLLTHDQVLSPEVARDVACEYATRISNPDIFRPSSRNLQGKFRVFALYVGPCPRVFASF